MYILPTCIQELFIFPPMKIVSILIIKYNNIHMEKENGIQRQTKLVSIAHRISPS